MGQHPLLMFSKRKIKRRGKLEDTAQGGLAESSDYTAIME